MGASGDGPVPGSDEQPKGDPEPATLPASRAATQQRASPEAARTAEALRRLADVADTTPAEMRLLAGRARLLAARLQGSSLGDALLDGEAVPVVSVVTHLGERLSGAGARVRRAEAVQLWSEGWTQSAIARAFAVTRQRAAALLRQGPDAPALDRERQLTRRS